MSQNSEVKSMLSQIHFFADIPNEVLHKLSQVTKEKVVPANNIIFRQGDAGDSFYIINSGKIRIFRKDREDVEIELARLGPGDTFGEMALLTQDPRAANVETLEETHLTVIYKDDFDKIIDEYPHILSSFIKKLSSWLVQMDLRIELQRKFIEYEKLSALGRLTANVAHEIRNPITVIGGLAKRLKKSITSGTKEEEYLELISSEAKRLEEILRNVLVFSNEPFFLKEKQDINKIVNESLNVYKETCKDCSIKVYNVLDNVTHIYIDKRYVKVAINNLVCNAIDAMPEGGMLTIATKEDFVNGKNYVIVEVTDTGVGIPQENILMIFEPFFTTKVSKKETGLGLPITKKIVESHGGFIKVDSKVGKGSIFTLYFPYRA